MASVFTELARALQEIRILNVKIKFPRYSGTQLAVIIVDKTYFPENRSLQTPKRGKYHMGKEKKRHVISGKSLLQDKEIRQTKKRNQLLYQTPTHHIAFFKKKHSSSPPCI